jgi:predicted nuclease of predicted toxin-antitoxin system
VSTETPVLRVWIDAMLPPVMARWCAEEPGVEARHTFDFGFLHADDEPIWEAAREAVAVLVSKDSDIRDRVERLGPPPQVVWITTGNISNRDLRTLLAHLWPRAVELLRAGEPLVEIGTDS